MTQKILLVEDDQTMRTLLKTLLTLEGFEVETFSDLSSDIHNMIKKVKPDAMIMDIHLRNLNGIELTKSIRIHPDFHSIVIIITSGMDQKKESLEAGANYFLLKPYMPDELINLLKTNEPA
jgi:DNA-binding response OmpR family regulator